MPWFVYLWMAFIVVGIIAAIALVGRPKNPPTYTPTYAVLTLITGLLQIWGLLYLVNN